METEDMHVGIEKKGEKVEKMQFICIKGRKVLENLQIHEQKTTRTIYKYSSYNPHLSLQSPPFHINP